MKTLMKLLPFVVLGLALAVVTASAETAEEIMKKSHMAYYYAGDDGIAEVRMVLTDAKGKERNREFTMLRIDEEEGGDQKYYTYFKKPSDVARMTFMVHKTTDGNDKRWIYVPAVDLIRPISADDKNSSFVGSDFTYEDVSGRHWSEDTHTLVEESELDGKAVYVIESVPKDADYDGFAKKVSYIDKATYLPLKEEYYDDKGELSRVFTAERVEKMDGILTVTFRRMTDVKKGSNTTVEFSDIKYNVGLTSDLFTERYLKNPPRQYIK
jgi:outer membrane lipoprotein-sorting protein